MSQEGTTDISYVLEDAAALRTDHIGVTSRMLFRFAAQTRPPQQREDADRLPLSCEGDPGRFCWYTVLDHLYEM